MGLRMDGFLIFIAVWLEFALYLGRWERGLVICECVDRLVFDGD